MVWSSPYSSSFSQIKRKFRELWALTIGGGPRKRAGNLKCLDDLNISCKKAIMQAIDRKLQQVSNTLGLAKVGGQEPYEEHLLPGIV